MSVDVTSLVTENLDVWSSTIKAKSATGRGSKSKRELYGVKKLRELILELAVRGLLVPQDPDDEPVNVLLEKIVVEKNRLLKEGKLRKQTTFPPIGEEERPFDIPNTWAYRRFGEVVFNRDGERKPVSASDRKSMQGKYDYYGASGVIDKVNGYLFEKSLLLIGEDGANLISRSTPIAFIAHGKYWVNNHAHVLDGLSLSFLEFVTLHINAISLEPYVTGTAQPKMNQAKMNGIVMAVPPETEQHRIVTKVNELMTLCDQLEQQQESSISAHQTLVETLLGALTNAADHQSFQQAWQRIAENFDVLFTTEHSINQLKQTILQLAVMGKLVPQDPSDEPASVLLEKIAAEKAQLIEDKKIKKQKPLPSISDEEKPFGLPQGWEFCRFFDANTVRSELVPALDFPNEWQIAPDSIEKNTGRLLENRTVLEVGAKGPNNRFYEGQILYSKIRPSLNKVVIAPYDGLCSADMYPIDCYTDSDYVLRYMSSESFLCQVRLAENRVKMPKLNLESLGMFLIALPPEEEQNRIVIKIIEIMALCDDMFRQIKEAQSIQFNLTDAITVQAIG